MKGAGFINPNIHPFIRRPLTLDEIMGQEKMVLGHLPVKFKIPNNPSLSL